MLRIITSLIVSYNHSKVLKLKYFNILRTDKLINNQNVSNYTTHSLSNLIIEF